MRARRWRFRNSQLNRAIGDDRDGSGWKTAVLFSSFCRMLGFLSDEWRRVLNFHRGRVEPFAAGTAAVPGDGLRGRDRRQCGCSVRLAKFPVVSPSTIRCQPSGNSEGVQFVSLKHGVCAGPRSTVSHCPARRLFSLVRPKRGSSRSTVHHHPSTCPQSVQFVSPRMGFRWGGIEHCIRV